VPTLISESRELYTARPKVITGLSKGSLIPPKHRNTYVFKIYFSDDSSQEIQTKDQNTISQLIQFAFNCEAVNFQSGSGNVYKDIVGYDTIFLVNGGVWKEEDGFTARYTGFEAYFYDMNGTKTSLVINYKD